MTLTIAERHLQDLGVTEPEEIDLEAIAFDAGAQLRYRLLDGCEARIIGRDNQAIITVNSRGSDRRKRYSVAHELGHWHHHRGKCLVCRVEETRPQTALSPERVADRYAADLLMPWYLFKPRARQQPKFNFEAVTALADMFDTSLTATAIRLVESEHTPSLVVCHGQNGRRWFARSPSVPDRWFPRDTLDVESNAFDILFGTAKDDTRSHKIGADAWFDRWDAEKYEMTEQSIRTCASEILTLIQITDMRMLD